MLAETLVQVAVCMITCRRPHGLGRLLKSLNNLTFKGSAPHIRFIIVDNDADGSARPVYEGVQAMFAGHIEFVIEPRRGIPQARNTAIRCAGEQADFIAFVDDDEVAEPGWLEELLRVQREFSADVVAGPVLSRHDEGTPAWVIRGGHFEHARYRDGQQLTTAATGNVLIASRVLRGLKEHFDESRALSGGTDVQFFCRVKQAGYSIVWADNAIVHEFVPASRATAGWILKRCYRHGTTRGARMIEFGTGRLRRVRALGLACVYLAAGMVLLPLGIVRGRSALVWSMRYVYYGLGVLAGLVGRHHLEYRKIHGR